MCGIAGYSLSADSRVDRTLAAQALLAGIAERGADAAGYAWRAHGGRIEVRKQRRGASELLERLRIPAAASQALVHVRDYTKGHPSIEANNHPVRHGPIVGIHNGIIVNDEEIFAAHGFIRHKPEMTVDSEAIFALAERFEGRPDALEQLRGTMATAWLDERNPAVLFVARAVGRPLWLGRGKREAFFASTRDALEVVEATLWTTLRKSEIDEGTLVALTDGEIASSERFTPDRSYDETPLPAVRAAEEGALCLGRLAVIAAAPLP
jgi:glucosamine 6-phosphate synthetase-like amidotransferase/phosphosugar isomerase protein